jgi:hypothetical protein
MNIMPKEPAAPSSSSVQPTTRFGARSGLAAVALLLVAVPFALVLLLVEDRWPPLLRADAGARDRLHGYAVTHAGFVGAMQLISDSGSGVAWVVVLAAVVVWLLWRRLPRLALFVVITGVGSSLLNAVAKSAVHRLRPVLTNPVAHEPGLSFPSGQRPGGHRRLLDPAPCLPADDARSVVQTGDRPGSVHGPGDRLLAHRSGRPLSLRRPRWLCPWWRMGCGHGVWVQRDPCRTRPSARRRVGGTRARAVAATGGPHFQGRREQRPLAETPTGPLRNPPCDLDESSRATPMGPESGQRCPLRCRR